MRYSRLEISWKKKDKAAKARWAPAAMEQRHHPGLGKKRNGDFSQQAISWDFPTFLELQDWQSKLSKLVLQQQQVFVLLQCGSKNYQVHFIDESLSSKLSLSRMSSQFVERNTCWGLKLYLFKIARTCSTSSAASMCILVPQAKASWTKKIWNA